MKKISILMFGITAIIMVVLAITNPFNIGTLSLIAVIILLLTIGHSFYQGYEKENKWMFLFASIFMCSLLFTIGNGAYECITYNESSTLTNVIGYTSLVSAFLTLLIPAFQFKLPKGRIGVLVASVIALLGMGVITIPISVFCNTPEWLDAIARTATYLILTVFSITAFLEIINVMFYKGKY